MTRRSTLAVLLLVLGAACPVLTHAQAQGETQAGPEAQDENLVQAEAQRQARTPDYSAAGLYNLANAYARAGKPGMAVLNYERARLLAPMDPDVEANLRFVRDSVHLPAEPATRFERAASIASPEVFAWSGLLGVVLAGSSLLAGRLRRGRRWVRRLGLGAGLLLVASTVCNAVVLWPILHDGVVITAATPVRVSPVPMGDPLFVLPEATTVRVSAEHEGFMLIRTREGRTGWVARANLVPVVPRAQPEQAPPSAQ